MLIEQASLRERAATDCAEAMARLNRARTGWHHFERKDKPAFIRWRAREFGALLSRAREVEIQIRDLQTLVHEVETETRRGFCDPYTAYERVIARRRNSGLPGEEEKRGSAQTHGNEPRRLSDFEKEALFQDWVRQSLGTHPDKMDDAAYARSFEAFKAHMFRPLPEEAPPAPKKPRRIENKEVEEEEEEDVRAVDARVKELYRRLVRRLHPDLRADGSAEVSALWHEVQEAYAASDVARLEILLALSDIEANQSDEQTLSQMRAVFAELQRSLRALEKSLLEAEGEDAWDFARLGPNEPLRLRVERQLKTDLATRARRLDLLSRTVAEWAQGPVANGQVSVAFR